jgi:hypothetical protein
VVAFKLFISLSWSPSNWLDINTSAEVDEIPRASYRVFDWQKDVPWTNNDAEQVIAA